VSLPVKYPIEPMEAKSVDQLPVGGGWQYEPKWDGFRCVAFKDGARVRLQSKAGKPLGRYFPDVVEQMSQLAARQCVLDGEIVIPVGKRLSFDELLLRVHPAASRVQTLVAAHPARYEIFDLLVDDRGKSLMNLPLAERRAALEHFAAREFRTRYIVLSRRTTSLATARKWLAGVGADLDGVIAKRLDCDYRAGERDGMVKVKRQRTADCVVGGFRYASKGRVVGSLLLGLYDAAGLLNHVGFTSSMAAAARPEITKRVERLVEPPGFTGRAPGGPSRWSTERSSEWEPLKPELVVEVAFDHVSGGRFRHGTRFLRWRPDKAPSQCTMDQLRL
jgi:ATP-dependent DNA ligase